MTAVEASSAGLGHGATFQVRLSASDTVQRRSTVVGVPGAAALAGVRVLVVEDMADTRELIAVALRSRGAEVFSAASGFEGLATLAETRPDVVVSDIAMPGMDGYTFVRHLQERTLLERPARRPIPAVAVTAFASHEDRVRALDAGFQAHVAKPVDMEVLVATLCDVLHPSGSAAR